MVFMVVMYIEIINNTKGSIESKIGDHVVWGGGVKLKYRMFTHSPKQKSCFRRIFLLLKSFLLTICLN